MKTYDKVYALVKKIPKGKISTYGQIGQMIGLNPRVVGWALNRLAKNRARSSELGAQKNKNKNHSSQLSGHSSVPWQRIINSKGTISTNKLSNIPLDLQKRLLENEGIKFDKNGKTDLKKYMWGK